MPLRLVAGTLLNQCLDELTQGPRLFPPKLFVLWLTPAFEKVYDDIVPAIREHISSRGFETIPVIGCSAGAVLYDEQVNENGGVLTCIASKVMGDSQPAIGPNARSDPNQAASRVVEALGLNTDRLAKARCNHVLLAFLPGYAGHEGHRDPYSYRLAEVFDALREHTFDRLHVFGGVACGGTRNPHGGASKARSKRGFECAAITHPAV